MARLTILHTSDLHNKLTSPRADRLRRLRADTPDSLLLDSGDAIWAGNIFWRPGGEPVLDLMSSIPYDAMAIGNREFHFLLPGLASKTSRAAFPVLCANLKGVGGRGSGVGVSTHLTLTRCGLRVTVFGLSVPCITERMMVKRVSAFYFDDPIDAANDIVPRLRPACDLLIALTHIGIKADRQLAESVPGIDLILGGHTHTVTDPPERVGDTWILHHGHHGHHVGRVEVDTESGVNVTNELIPLGEP